MSKKEQKKTNIPIEQNVIKACIERRFCSSSSHHYNPGRTIGSFLEEVKIAQRLFCEDTTFEEQVHKDRVIFLRSDMNPKLKFPSSENSRPFYNLCKNAKLEDVKKYFRPQKVGGIDVDLKIIVREDVVSLTSDFFIKMAQRFTLDPSSSKNKKLPGRKIRPKKMTKYPSSLFIQSMNVLYESVAQIIETRKFIKELDVCTFGTFYKKVWNSVKKEHEDYDIEVKEIYERYIKERRTFYVKWIGNVLEEYLCNLTIHDFLEQISTPKIFVQKKYFLTIMKVHMRHALDFDYKKIIVKYSNEMLLTVHNHIIYKSRFNLTKFDIIIEEGQIKYYGKSYFDAELFSSMDVEIFGHKLCDLRKRYEKKKEIIQAFDVYEKERLRVVKNFENSIVSFYVENLQSMHPEKHENFNKNVETELAKLSQSILYVIMQYKKVLKESLKVRTTCFVKIESDYTFYLKCIFGDLKEFERIYKKFVLLKPLMLKNLFQIRKEEKECENYREEPEARISKARLKREKKKRENEKDFALFKCGTGGIFKHFNSLGRRMEQLEKKNDELSNEVESLKSVIREMKKEKKKLLLKSNVTVEEKITLIDSQIENSNKKESKNESEE